MRRGCLARGVPLVLAVAFLQITHWTFSSVSLRRSQKRLNVKNWIGGETPGSDVDSKLLTRKIRDLGRIGRFKQAKDVFAEAELKDAIMYSAIISAAAVNREFDEGLELFEEMKNSELELSDFVYSAVLKLLGEKGDYAAAARMWQEMHDLGLAEEGSPRQQSCFTGLINAAAATGDVQQAQKEIDAAPFGVKLHGGHFGCLLKACRESADPDAARQVILQMRDAGMERNIIHYTTYMGACARFVAQEQGDRAGELETQVLEEMKKDQVQANEYFLEERAALNLQTASLRSLRAGLEETPSAAAFERTGKMLAAELLSKPSLRLTKVLRDLREEHPKLRTAMEQARG